MSGESRLTVFSEISDGVQTVYPIRFELGYLNKTDVYVYQGEHGDYANQLPYSWVDSSNIELSFPLSAGESFWIRRIVNRSDLNYYFQSASLNPRALDRLHLQLLMLQQELMDGFGDRDGLGNIKNTLDMRGYGIVNMLGGTDPAHAVNKAQLDDEAHRIDTVIQRVDALNSQQLVFPMDLGYVTDDVVTKRYDLGMI